LIDWGSLGVERVWPVWLGLVTAGLLAGLWFYHRKAYFPDIVLITRTIPYKGHLDRAPLWVGGVILVLLVAVLMQPSIVRVITVDQRARDFLVIVDTSRSMRHDTQVRREAYDLRYERRAGTFSTAVDDPGTLPYLARYELARESLLSFLSQRKAQDRVAMIYFNDNVFTMSAPTSNIDFVTNQLASMDDYVNWGTDIATAMQSGLDLLARYPDQNKKAIILLTDAEATYTREVEQQLARVASEGVSFYLLWITTDETNMSNDEVAAVLEYARTVGTVVTIENLDARNLENSLRDISTLEDYSYQEEKRQRIDLAQPLFEMTRWLLLVWLVLVATFFHPSMDRKVFEGGQV
jgi:Mg-chelatase subunit ChlD